MWLVSPVIRAWVPNKWGEITQKKYKSHYKTLSTFCACIAWRCHLIITLVFLITCDVKETSNMHPTIYLPIDVTIINNFS